MELAEPGIGERPIHLIGDVRDGAVGGGERRRELVVDDDLIGHGRDQTARRDHELRHHGGHIVIRGWSAGDGTSGHRDQDGHQE